MMCSVEIIGGHGFFGPLALNILSMRSVMMKPPTMLLVAATMAMVPSTVASVALVFAGEDDGAHHGDGIEGVGQRHQRRVQQGRDSADHLESDERRQHEYVEACDQIDVIMLPLCCGGASRAAKNSRTRGFTTSPPCGHQRFADDFVVRIDVQLAILDQVQQERGEVARVHLAGVIGNRAGQIDASR